MNNFGYMEFGSMGEDGGRIDSLFYHYDPSKEDYWDDEDEDEDEDEDDQDTTTKSNPMLYNLTPHAISLARGKHIRDTVVGLAQPNPDALLAAAEDVVTLEPCNAFGPGGFRLNEEYEPLEPYDGYAVIGNMRFTAATPSENFDWNALPFKEGDGVVVSMPVGLHFAKYPDEVESTFGKGVSVFGPGTGPTQITRDEKGQFGVALVLKRYV